MKERNYYEFMLRWRCIFDPYVVFTNTKGRDYSFDYAVLLLSLNWFSPFIEIVLSFDFTKMPSPQRFYSEPSLSQRRALVVSMTSPRQLVKSKESVQ